MSAITKNTLFYHIKFETTLYVESQSNVPDKRLEIIKKGLEKSINCSSDPLCWESEGQEIYDLIYLLVSLALW